MCELLMSFDELDVCVCCCLIRLRDISLECSLNKEIFFIELLSLSEYLLGFVRSIFLAELFQSLQNFSSIFLGAHSLHLQMVFNKMYVFRLH
jgi:hypothetical protein